MSTIMVQGTRRHIIRTIQTFPELASANKWTWLHRSVTGLSGGHTPVIKNQLRKNTACFTNSKADPVDSEKLNSRLPSFKQGLKNHKIKTFGNCSRTHPVSYSSSHIAKNFTLSRNLFSYLGFEMKHGSKNLMSRFYSTSNKMFNSENENVTQSAPVGGSTIYALSSGHGKCGVAVIRVTGSASGQAVTALTRRKTLPKPRQAKVQRLYHPVTGQQIDRGLLLWFPGPESFTGEDSCEFQVHGGPAVITAMLDALGSLPRLCPAEAGEFTKRAFANHKLDLTEVEGLADLIHAETEAQRRQALRQMEGALSKLYTSWRHKLIKCVAYVEAYIDFSEEEEIEDDVLDRTQSVVQEVLKEINKHLKDNRRGERLRTGVHIAILGEPNVGKSSLLNAISQRPAAIVSPIAGTTRDVVETALNVGGYPVLLSDTAGLREATDQIEREGVARALARAEQADLKILVLDACKVQEWLELTKEDKFSNFLQNHMQKLGLSYQSSMENGKDMKDHTVSSDSKHSEIKAGDTQLPSVDSIENYKSMDTSDLKSDVVEEVDIAGFGDILVVLNKVDLMPSDWAHGLQEKVKGIQCCPLSCVTEEGLDNFISALRNKAKYMCESAQLGNPSLTQARHRKHVTNCRQLLEDFLHQSDVVLGAQILRQAVRQIGKITGQVSSEEILDVIFRDFCIGK